MAKRPPALPTPTMEEREVARQSAAALRLAIKDPTTMGEPSVMHIDYSRPRRAEWIKTWANLPGFKLVNGHYQHDSLPGWSYARSEIVPELIPDLEALAEHGIRPTTETTSRER